ncbi:MAG TPA: acyclic terpene utilization AtuA family protein, partial [Casimicrobiaceae bacterium]|nr:acyclic terpene utilization AtuA family protein [Casimicrobiaceae bacterium]
MRETLRLGGGAGFAGDRLDAPIDLAEHGELDYLVLECLAERTIALAQLRRRRDPAAGYDARLAERIESLLPIIARRRVRLLGNFGAANPLAAADAILAVAKRLALPVKVAAVTGDDVLDMLDLDAPTMEAGVPLSRYSPIVSANAYLGAEAMLPAIASGADIVVTGRVADPSLFVAPLMHEYGWAANDFDRLARGTAVGHLLECLAERTIALAQLRRRRDPAAGYDARLAERIESLLPILARRRVRLLGNFGAANPLAAADAILAVAK